MNSKLKKLTGTAVMLALLVSLQAVTSGMGQLVTGSCVNLVLAVTSLIFGPVCGTILAVISPFLAFMLGIGPAFLPIVPGIAAGNTVLVLLIYFKAGKQKEPSVFGKAAGIAISSVCKFAVLYMIVVRLILPLLQLKPQQAAVISASFTWPQLFTALIGTSIAMIIYPRLNTGKKNK